MPQRLLIKSFGAGVVYDRVADSWTVGGLGDGEVMRFTASDGVIVYPPNETLVVVEPA